ncbi:Ribonucleases P/MRP protein subunit POP5 [Cladophialophora carrionii]|uniref:Ribonucleases P/MRP protein subunit POP5 n=1 Tax=Cladophialophora carrionii TaxID=86049 RepID=A0A1C1C883_9EURO|nr:Ribonucleases P/MRP protein subunit POP5 [Cladophialophora carrionii]
MVRIKQRYLLFNILYPSPSPPPPPPTTTDGQSTPPPAYILFSRPSPSHLSASLLSTMVRNELHTLFGDHGLSVTQSALRVVYFSPATSTGILRVPRAHFRMVWAALAFITAIPPERDRGGRATRGAGRQCVIRVVRVSGTIRKSEEELLRRARRELVRAKMEGRSTDDQEDEVALGNFAGGKGKQTSGASRLTATEDADIMDLVDEEDEQYTDMSDD